MPNLSDVYKYPKNPMVNSRIDRLEDRIERRERNLNAGVSSVQTLDMESAYPTAVVAMASSPSSNDEKAGYDMETTEAVPMYKAEDFSKYVGQIVHDGYEDCYVEVIGVVENLVAIKRRPNAAPVLIDPRYLRLF